MEGDTDNKLLFRVLLHRVNLSVLHQAEINVASTNTSIFRTVRHKYGIQLLLVFHYFKT